MNATFMVRKISHGVGVEKDFSASFPNIVKMEIVKSPQVRKAKLYYVRERKIIYRGQKDKSCEEIKKSAMRIKYSPHARKRLRERKINQDEVLIVLHHPGNKIYASRNRSRNRIIANKKI